VSASDRADPRIGVWTANDVPDFNIGRLDVVPPMISGFVAALS
jgi:hypothetical protein